MSLCCLLTLDASPEECLQIWVNRGRCSWERSKARSSWKVSTGVWWWGHSEIHCCSSAGEVEPGDRLEHQGACAEDAAAGRQTCLPAPG